MGIDNNIYYCDLYDIYNKLLTDKQKKYFYDYYFLDLSLAEIAETYNLSRNAIFDQIKHTENKLKEFEDNLKLKEKIDKIENLDLDSKIKELILDIIKEW